MTEKDTSLKKVLLALCDTIKTLVAILFVALGVGAVYTAKTEVMLDLGAEILLYVFGFCFLLLGMFIACTSLNAE